MSVPAFQQAAPGVNAAANGTTSVNVALSERVSGAVVRVVNMNAVPAFVRFGIGAQTATNADVPVGINGQYADVYVGAADNVAFVLESGATVLKVYFCPGS